MTKLETYLQSLQRFGIKPGLERIRELLNRAGNPQREYPVVLVGGTNGKGSTCEFLARMLAEDGNKVGLYTSPHLYSWNERIRVLHPSPPIPLSRLAREGVPKAGARAELFPGAIGDDELDALFDEALPHIEAIATSELGQPTEFEVLTLLGLWHFARQKVEAAVVEVGLGGRWDATNVTEPIVSVITHVALDHCDRLGSTHEAIARDKVHIARKGRVLVTAETRPEVRRVFEEHCRAVNCELRIAKHNESASFQEMNLATARLAQEVLYTALGRSLHPSSFIPHPAAVPGRFEIISQNPTVILDGANNPDGASTLASELQRFMQEKPDAKLILVLGILDDKDYAAMVESLAPLAAVVIATQSTSPRAASAGTIATVARKHCANIERMTPVPAAVQRALELADESDIICITGSFYTVAEVERDTMELK